MSMERPIKVSIYVRDHISFIERPDLNQFDNSIESIFIEVNKDQLNTTKNILIGVIYRPPNQDMDIFNEKISEMLETIRKEEKFCYLLGDCNINILNYESHRLTGDFVDLLSSYSFLPLITRPTRITASSATLIDNIFTNHIENLDHSTQGLLVTDVSDHYPIFHINNRSYIGESDIYVTKRIFSERNKQAFKIALNELDWNEIYGASETNNAFHRFHDTLGTLLNKYFPKVRIKRKYNNRKPWLTDSLRMSIKTKNKLYYCYKRINCVKNEVKYKTYKSKLQKLLKVAEKQYYQEFLMKYKNNMKKSWGIIKSIINKNKSHLYQTKFKLSDGKIVSDKTTISKHFNEFFLNVGPNLAKTIPKMDTDPKFYMGESIKKSLFLEPVTLDEIMKIVSSLKETATGYDDISAMFLKMSAEYICNPLVHICNLSFSEGVFPDSLKIALDIKIDNQEISQVLKTKFLGVAIDSKLSWKEHIAYITGKIARGIGVISKARRYLNRDSLLSLYYSFIYPYLIYCNHVWGAAAKTHTRTLCTLQKRVIRIISGVKPRTHSDHLFKELKLLKFQDINTYLIGKLMFKVYSDDLVIFETWFEKNNSFHDYNTRQKDQYHIPSFKTKLGQSSLRFSGVTIWNSIHKLGITKETSEFSFSKTLKQFLLLGILWNGNYIPGGHIIFFFFNPFSTLRKTCAV